MAACRVKVGNNKLFENIALNPTISIQLFHDGETLSYRNQSIDLPCKSMDQLLYDKDLGHERVNTITFINYMKRCFAA